MNSRVTNLKGPNGAFLADAATDADTPSGVTYDVLDVITEAEFSAITAQDWTGADITDITWPVGTKLYGKFSGISVSTGIVVCYVKA